MRGIARKTLRTFWVSKPEYSDSNGPLEAWYAEAEAVAWHTPAEIKQQYKTASVLKNSSVVFNRAGIKYRLVVAIHYKADPGSLKGFLELVFRSDNADFSYAGETTEGGRKLMEYHYRVPLEASHYVFRSDGSAATTAYEGIVLAQPTPIRQRWFASRCEPATCRRTRGCVNRRPL